ncbi:hypothetical protein SBOR_1326 [Sclerotinia borealis F-4128]|uniref:Uncharacterized protein n=1 Tax=Sclerotinia borealis (strain F-4128) TaxID=1432307 RepID=W9CQM1_SCLBF|nr:hypothetical protein SBOR_1326 [Sclerotinia borealis F-4128]
MRAPMSADNVELQQRLSSCSLGSVWQQSDFGGRPGGGGGGLKISWFAMCTRCLPPHIEDKKGRIRCIADLGLGAGHHWLVGLPDYVALQIRVAAQRGKDYADVEKGEFKSYAFLYSAVVQPESWRICKRRVIVFM